MYKERERGMNLQVSSKMWTYKMLGRLCFASFELNFIEKNLGLPKYLTVSREKNERGQRTKKNMYME